MRAVDGVDPVGAERRHVVDVLAERSRRDPGTEPERELDGEGSDPTSRAQHQHVVTRSDVAVVDQGLLRSQAGKGQCGSLEVA